MRLIDDGPSSGLPVVSGQLVSISAGQQTSDGITQDGEALLPAQGEASDTIPLAVTIPGSDEQRSKS